METSVGEPVHKERELYQVNVFLNPMQSLLLIKEPDVQIAILADFLTRQESKRADTVVDLNKHHTVI